MPPPPPPSDAAPPHPPKAPEVSPSFFFLEPIKNAQLDSAASVTLTDFKAAGAPGVFSFGVTVSASSPFLFLEIANSAEDAPSPIRTGVFDNAAAGWFSDNNFVAEAGVTYSLTYTAFQPFGPPHVVGDKPHAMTLEQFKQRLQVRVLQDTLKC